jgi:hypothetical protein
VSRTGEILAMYRQSEASAEEKKASKEQPGLRRLRTFAVLGKDEELVKIDAEEVAKLKKLCNANHDLSSLILLGFKKPESIPFHHTVEQPYYVYPSDDKVQGSTAAFAHLYASMLRKNVVGIGELLQRKDNTSRLVAIHPVAEEFFLAEEDDEEGYASQKYPPGWILTILPFENEIRAFPPDATIPAKAGEQAIVEVGEETLRKTEELINEMKINKEVGDGWKNMHVEKFWNYIEAIALEQSVPLDKNYAMNPIPDVVVEHLRSFVDKLEATLPPPGAEDNLSKKRKASTNTKLKADQNTDWAAELQNGNLQRYPNADLSNALLLYGKKKSGTKAELIERLTHAINGTSP